MPAVNSGSATGGYTKKNYTFADASWEVVGQAPSGDEFVPQGFEVHSASSHAINPLFADFGGTGPKTHAKRYHLPPHLAVNGRSEPERDGDEGQREAMHAQQLEQVREAAYQQGREEALREAEAVMQQKLQTLENSFTNVLRDLNKQLGEELERTEQRAVQLAVDIAHKIIDGAVEINPEYVLRIVREALNLAGGALVQKVRVSPQDMEFIDVVGVAKQLKEYDGSWKFEADASIRSGCVVETSAGEIDYQLDAAWERLRENIIKVVR